MNEFNRSYWARTAMTALVVSAGVFGAMRMAAAVPGGETRAALSFAGTLTGASGAQMLTFTFKKGATTVCAPRVTVTPATGGQFTTEIPLAGCPSTLFDGSDVTFDVTVGSTVVVRDQAVNSVPYARYADRVGAADCPTGYERDATSTGITVCRKGDDEVVRVGRGASAFWIDRYEASVWQNADGTGTQYGAGSAPNYPSTFPVNGQGVTQVYAYSRTGVAASALTTWFQADGACRASGKRLPSRNEWLAAARGTPDPGASPGTAGSCVTMGAPRVTGMSTSCSSMWGAQDMIGNLAEWTDEWFAGNGSTTPINGGLSRWPSEYNMDGTWNVNSAVDSGGGGVAIGIPSAAIRGGAADYGVQAGVFALALNHGPAYWAVDVGFRCVIPR